LYRHERLVAGGAATKNRRDTVSQQIQIILISMLCVVWFVYESRRPL
jgi:hypothetical protein